MTGKAFYKYWKDWQRSMAAATFFDSAINEHSPFPDGQPHIDVSKSRPTSELLCRIRTPEDLVKVALWVDIARQCGIRRPFKLKISYLMGARMDRALSPAEPYTLRAVCQLINSLGFDEVGVLCPHSQAVGDLLKNYHPFLPHIEDDFYSRSIEHFLEVVVLGAGREEEFSIVYPDVGAAKRFAKSTLKDRFPNANFVMLHKERDERTGKILGTKIIQGTPSKRCIILDDLCDGGATFVGAAVALRGAGAERVGLAVFHGIFSKGLPLMGIECVCTTNSYCERETTDDLFVYQLGQ